MPEFDLDYAADYASVQAVRLAADRFERGYDYVERVAAGESHSLGPGKSQRPPNLVVFLSGYCGASAGGSLWALGVEPAAVVFPSFLSPEPVLPTALTGNPATWTIAIFCWPLTNVCILTAFLSAVVEWLHGELARRTEVRLLAQRFELAQSSYEALRRQHEQVMMV